MTDALPQMQMEALLAMNQAPLWRTDAGWCHDGGTGSHWPDSVIEALQRRKLCRIDRRQRRGKAYILQAGRAALKEPGQ